MKPAPNRYDFRALEIDGLVLEDRLYVNGQRIREDEPFVIDGRVRPNVQMDPGEIQKLIDSPELENRVCRCARVTGWEGEFVLSIFLNFARTGTSLFAEARYFLLAPFSGECLAVNGLEPQPRFGQRVKTVSAAVPQAARLLVLAWPRLVGELRAGIRRWRGQRDRSHHDRDGDAHQVSLRVQLDDQTIRNVIVNKKRYRGHQRRKRTQRESLHVSVRLTSTAVGTRSVAELQVAPQG